QLVADLGLRLHDVRERTAPGLQDGVLFVEFVELDGAVVGVDGGLDGVTDVADLVVDQLLTADTIGVGGVRRGFRQAGALGVGQVRQGGVAVDDPLDSPVDDGRVGLRVGGQPRCNLVHALAGI